MDQALWGLTVSLCHHVPVVLTWNSLSCHQQLSLTDWVHPLWAVMSQCCATSVGCLTLLQRPRCFVSLFLSLCCSVKGPCTASAGTELWFLLCSTQTSQIFRLGVKNAPSRAWCGVSVLPVKCVCPSSAAPCLAAESQVVHIRRGGREAHADHQPSFTQCLPAAHQDCRRPGKSLFVSSVHGPDESWKHLIKVHKQ